jgi:hypothetical protein
VGEGIFFAGLKHVAIKVIASYTEDQIITSDPSQILAIKKAKQDLDTANALPESAPPATATLEARAIAGDLSIPEPTPAPVVAPAAVPAATPTSVATAAPTAAPQATPVSAGAASGTSAAQAVRAAAISEAPNV